MTKKSFVYALLSVLFVSFIVFANLAGAIDVSSCGTLSLSGTYVLTKNVSSTGTCFKITANDVTVDCDGYSVSYVNPDSSGGKDGHAFDVIGVDGTIVENCVISRPTLYGSGNNHAFYVINSSNGTFQDNVVLTACGGASGFYLVSSSYNNILNNKITTLRSDDLSPGIQLLSSSHNNIANNNITAAAGRGVYLNSSPYNALSGNDVYTPKEQSYVLEGGTQASYDNAIDDTNYAEGYPVNYTFNANDAIVAQNIPANTYGQIICGWCDNVTYDDVTMGGDGINLFNTANSRVTNSNINTNVGESI